MKSFIPDDVRPFWRLTRLSVIAALRTNYRTTTTLMKTVELTLSVRTAYIQYSASMKRSYKLEERSEEKSLTSYLTDSTQG